MRLAHCLWVPSPMRRSAQKSLRQLCRRESCHTRVRRARFITQPQRARLPPQLLAARAGRRARQWRPAAPPVSKTPGARKDARCLRLGRV